MMPTIKTLLFDFGNVFIDVHFQKTTDAIMALGINTKSAEKLLFDPHSFFRQFQMGEISSAQFRDEIRKIGGSTLTDQVIDEAWCAMIGKVQPKQIVLIKELQKNYRVALFSNTDEIHTTQFEQEFISTYGYQMTSLFDKVYYSQVIGKAKPDLEAFIHVIKDLNEDPRSILFLDDLSINIKGAQAAGLQAAQVKEHCNPRVVLEEWGLI